MTLTAAQEALGAEVWDALVQASAETAPNGSGADGFDVIAEPFDVLVEVVVVLRLEGALLGCGTPGVRRAYFYRWERVLLAAGFAVRRAEFDGVPTALFVTRADDGGGS